jgi:hypothetical protein
MKKTILPLLVLIMTINQHGYSQTTNTSTKGKAVTEIFTDFHYNIDDTSKTTGFGMNRAYFGYNYQPEGDFSGSIILNLGSPEDLTAGAKHRKYSFFREASLSYTKDKLKMSFGITTTRATIFQQTFLGKRYIADNFQSKNGYSYVADVGFVLDYTINNIFKVDFAVMNGEGYSELQLDNSVKSSVGINIVPVKNTVIRLYSDFDHPNNVWQNLSIIFVGYKNQLITFGAEAAYKTNIDKISGHDGWGFSGTCAVTVAPKTEVFGRYDYTSSSVMPDETLHWNSKNDGQFATFGFQYTFNQYAQLALDYQGTFPYNPGTGNSDGIFLNAHFKF